MLLFETNKISTHTKSLSCETAKLKKLPFNKDCCSPSLDQLFKYCSSAIKIKREPVLVGYEPQFRIAQEERGTDNIRHIDTRA